MPGLIPQGGGFWEKGQRHAAGAMGAFQGQQPGRTTKLEAPGLTAGGAVGATAGMGLAGAQAGAMIGAAGGPIGAGGGALIGGAVGLISYLLS